MTRPKDASRPRLDCCVMRAKTCSHGKGWDAECIECEIAWVRGTIESFEPIVNDAKRKLKELEDALAKTTAVQA